MVVVILGGIVCLWGNFVAIGKGSDKRYDYGEIFFKGSCVGSPFLLNFFFLYETKVFDIYLPTDDLHLF